MTCQHKSGSRFRLLSVLGAVLGGNRRKRGRGSSRGCCLGGKGEILRNLACNGLCRANFLVFHTSFVARKFRTLGDGYTSGRVVYEKLGRYGLGFLHLLEKLRKQLKRELGMTRMIGH